MGRPPRGPPSVSRGTWHLHCTAQLKPGRVVAQPTRPVQETRYEIHGAEGPTYGGHWVCIRRTGEHIGERELGGSVSAAGRVQAETRTGTSTYLRQQGSMAMAMATTKWNWRKIRTDSTGGSVVYTKSIGHPKREHRQSLTPIALRNYGR